MVPNSMIANIKIKDASALTDEKLTKYRAVVSVLKWKIPDEESILKDQDDIAYIENYFKDVQHSVDRKNGIQIYNPKVKTNNSSTSLEKDIQLDSAWIDQHQKLNVDVSGIKTEHSYSNESTTSINYESDNSSTNKYEDFLDSDDETLKHDLLLNSLNDNTNEKFNAAVAENNFNIENKQSTNLLATVEEERYLDLSQNHTNELFKPIKCDYCDYSNSYGGAMEMEKHTKSCQKIRSAAQIRILRKSINNKVLNDNSHFIKTSMKNEIDPLLQQCSYERTKNRNTKLNIIEPKHSACKSNDAIIVSGNSTSLTEEIPFNQEPILPQINKVIEIPQKTKSPTKIDFFECRLCTSRFVYRLSLQNHIEAVHRGLKHFKCGYCKYICSSSDSMEQHTKTMHKRWEYFKCGYCDYCCSQNSIIQHHMKTIHWQKKPLKCNYCDYTFSHKNSLEQHIEAVHMGPKCFKCKYCVYTCSHIGSMEQHIKAVHMQ